jgi:hypothetical protein
VNVKDPCLSSSAAGGEHWDGDLVDLGGLDNDGDMIYETQDADCRTTHVPSTKSAAFELAPPYPNPAKDRVTLAFGLPSTVIAKVMVSDQAGRAVRTIAHREFAAGRHTLEWDTRDDRGRAVRSGVYYVSFRAAGLTSTRAMVFVR